MPDEPAASNPQFRPRVVQGVEDLLAEIVDLEKQVEDLNKACDRLGRIVSENTNYIDRLGLRDMSSRQMGTLSELADWWLTRKKTAEAEEHHWRRMTQRANITQGIMAVAVFILAIVDFVRTVYGH